METFYVLWMPTRKDITLKGDRKLSLINLHDSWLLGGYYVWGNITPEMNVILKYWPHRLLIPYNSTHSVQLKFIDKDEHGFIVYSLDTSCCNENDFTGALSKTMNPSIYHYIKSAFHKHENHLINEDALLRPYVKESETPLKVNDEILLYYLKQYKYKFLDFIIYASTEYEAAKVQLNSLFNINKGIKALRTIIEKGNAIKGEQEYYEYLRTIAMQRDCVSEQFVDEIRDNCHTIDKLLIDVTASYNICTAGLGIKYGRWGIYFGLAGIVVSTIGIFCEPNFKPLKEYISNIENRSTTSINDSISILKKQVIEIQKCIESKKNTNQDRESIP